MLPSNLVNWPFQGQFQCPCIHKSRITGSANAGPFSEISSILIRQAQSKLETVQTGTYREWSAPPEDQGGFTWYAQFTSSNATDGSANHDYLLHDLMESSTLWMMLGVYYHVCRSLRTLYTVNKILNQLWLPILLLGIIDLSMSWVQGSGAAITDHLPAPIGKYINRHMF